MFNRHTEARAAMFLPLPKSTVESLFKNGYILICYCVCLQFLIKISETSNMYTVTRRNSPPFDIILQDPSLPAISTYSGYMKSSCGQYYECS